MQYKLAIYALEKSDKLFVASMLELARKKFGVHWVLDDNAGQVTLVDTDQPEGLSFWQAYHTHKKLVAFARSNHCQAALYLEKPLRVQPFTELLKALAVNLPGFDGAAPETAVPATVAAVPASAKNALNYQPESYLAGLLQHSLRTQQAIRLGIEHCPALYVLPSKRRWYSTPIDLNHLASSQKLLLSAPASSFIQQPMTEAALLDEVTKQGLPHYDINSLLWVSTPQTSHGRLLAGRALQHPVRLRQWPNFAILPYEPVHMQLAAFIMKTPASVARIASNTRIPLSTVVDFYNACAMVDLLITVDNSQDVDVAAKPVSVEKRSLFKNILQRLVG
jgi:hypothetical protein